MVVPLCPSILNVNLSSGGLYDLLASYDPGFYVSGVTIALSGIILFGVPPLQNLRKAKELQSRDI